MKTHVMLTLFLWFTATVTYSQVGMTTNNPNKDAVLDLNNSDGTNTKGLLLPKVALTSTTSFAPLSAHVKGMHVYNTVNTADIIKGPYFNDGIKWQRLETNNVWSLNGNNISAGDYLGTSDNTIFRIKTNGVERINVGTPTAKVILGSQTSTAANSNIKMLLDNGSTSGAIQIKTPKAVAGAKLISDANGGANWGSTSVDGTGIYHATTKQDIDVYTTILTDSPIVMTVPGSYLITIRWFGDTDGSDAYFIAGADFYVSRNNLVVDSCTYTQFSASPDTNARICTSVNLFADVLKAGDVLTIQVTGRDPSIIGNEGLANNVMPTIFISKI